MPTNSKALIDASKDEDLRERAIVLAAEAGIDSPEAWVASKLYRIVSAPAAANGNSIASVRESAQVRYDQAAKALPPKPGKDPAAVTDDNLRHAINAVKNQPV